MEPIAIVGIGCRLPGGVKSPADLWKLIIEEKIANTSHVPPSRFNIDGYHHQDNDRPGSFTIPGGYFLDDHPADFDPSFFKISPVEAMWMDPQQRKILEVVYEAIENSGSTLQSVSKQVTGCFVASFSSDFQQMAFKEPDFRHSYSTTGVDPSVLGNRVSYVFDLRGPSFLVNTACSSSMYALDSACMAINRGECEGAIVGGTNWILTVDQHMNTAKLGVLSPTSTCHAFDESADGYGRAEAVGALYVKSLSAALRDGNPVRAIIRSTATNCNGRHSDNGIAYPSVEGQASVMEAAHKLGHLDPASTAYIECHGTGTPTGDPIEVRAVSKAFRNRTEHQGPILIGSIKPNIGHSEAASSISTLIKAVLALERGVIPPTAGIKKLNSAIPWKSLNVDVVTKPTPFPVHYSVQRIGISAFGYGGTNGHAIVESTRSFLSDYCGYSRISELGTFTRNTSRDDHAHLLLLSAHSKPSLSKYIDALRVVNKGYDPLDLAYTLAHGRPSHGYRTFAVCRESSSDSDLVLSRDNIVNSAVESRVAFAFTGQGAQWAGMGSQLLKDCPSFLATIRGLDEVLSRLKEPPEWKVEDALLNTESRDKINEPIISQTLCTAIQIATVDLLRSWNINPVASIGHSSGEIAAAYTAGLISVSEAIVIAYLRGRAVSSPAKLGAMLAVGLGAQEVKTYLEGQEGLLVLACHNSPNSVTVSGDAEAVHELQSTLTTKGIFARMLKTGGQAYHSHHMAEVSSRYRKLLDLESKSLGSPSKDGQRLPMFSTVTGTLVDRPSMSAMYWCENLTSPVLFNQATHAMLKSDLEIKIIVEIGPHSTLSGPIRQICAAANLSSVHYMPSLKRGENDHAAILKLVGQLWAYHLPIDTEAVTCREYMKQDGSVVRENGKLLVDLPPYEWTYAKRHWAESRQSKEHRQSPYPRHDLLGRKVLGTSDIEPVWRNILRHKDLPWLKHHSLGGEAIFPAAGYFALAIEAVTQASSFRREAQPIDGYTLSDVSISSAISIPDDEEGVEILFSLRPCPSSGSKWHVFTVTSLSHGEWKVNVTGRIATNVRDRGRNPTILPHLPISSSYASWNKKLRTLGFDYGSTFRNSTTIHTDGVTHNATADMTIRQECGLLRDESRYVIHPSSIDSCLQGTLFAIFKGNINELEYANVLAHFDEVTVWVPASHHLDTSNARIASWMSHQDARSHLCHAQLLGPDGSLIADFAGVRCVTYEAGMLQLQDAEISQKDLYTKLHWDLDIDHIGSANSIMEKGGMSLERLLQILLHKSPSSRLLCLGPKAAKHLPKRRFAASITIAVRSDEDFEKLTAMYASEKDVHIVLLNHSHELIGEHRSFTAFDVVIRSQNFDVGVPEIYQLEELEELIKTDGYLVTEGRSNPHSPAGTLQRICSFDTSTIVWRKSGDVEGNGQVNGFTGHRDTVAANSVLLIYRESQHPFHGQLASALTAVGFTVRTSTLADAKPSPKEPIIVLAELESPVFESLTEDELRAVQRMSDGISSVAWVTGGCLLRGSRPAYTMAGGWARVVRNENQLLDLVLVDIDDATDSKERLKHMLTKMILTWSNGAGRSSESEYCINDGAVYIGRLLPDDDINEIFAMGDQQTTLVAMKDLPALRMETKSGRSEFHQDLPTPAAAPLHPEEVEIDVRAMGLAKGQGTVSADFGTSALFNHEIAGLVTRVGSAVPPSIAVGDRVFGLSFDNSSTLQKTRHDLVRRMRQEETWENLATLPTASVTALYALEDLAQVQPTENVVVLDDCGIMGLIATQLCVAKGAKPIMIGFPKHADSQLESFGTSVLAATEPEQDITMSLERLLQGGRIDVILCSASVETRRLEECLKAAAPFSRVVILGTSTEPMSSLKISNASVTSFELRTLYQHKPGVVKRLFSRFVELRHEGIINQIWPVHSKQPLEMKNVARSITNEVAYSANALSLSRDALVEYHMQRETLRFSENATYLLVGCLGGLGRSVASWMIERGAKHLAFLSRSGVDHPAAAATVASLQDSGAHIQVYRADVASKSDVETVVAEVDPRFPIRGVLNAAVVFRDTIFRNMTLQSWHEVLAAKARGSTVLHEVFSKTGELDFFVMTSSISATLGASGQSNYAAANSFLDGLAHHRQSLGLPGVSLVLPAITGIGHAAENPEIEASLRRRGVTWIGEPDMLRAFEAAMTPANALPRGTSQIIAGLQPLQLAESIKNAKADIPWMQNPRLGILVAEMGKYSSEKRPGTDESVQERLENAANKADAVKLVEDCLVERLSRLLMINEDDIKGGTSSLANIGLDSMIGAEFRNWIYREFKVDMPFQQLLAGHLTIGRLADDIVGRVQG